MKRSIIFFTAVFVICAIGFAEEGFFFDNLSAAQRYDLADSYNRVAGRYGELGDEKKAEEFQNMVFLLFPDFEQTERPVDADVLSPPVSQQVFVPDPNGEKAALYYFDKILRAISRENTSLALSALAETLFLPPDIGLDKETVKTKLEWAFEKYDASQWEVEDFFDMKTLKVNALDNGFWRLDVRGFPEGQNQIPEITFWEDEMGFYFKKFPEGWRLAAIGPAF